MTQRCYNGCRRHSLVGYWLSVVIRDFYMGGNVNITTEDSAGNSSQNVILDNVKFPGGTTGLIMGGSGAMLGCDWVGCTTGAKLYGNGWTMHGCRIEDCTTGILLGLDSAGTNQGASGFAMIGGTMEGCVTHIDFSGTCSGFYIGSIGMLGHSTSGPGQNVHTQYGIFVRANTASNGVFSSVSHGGWADVAGVEIDAATSRANLLFVGCNIQFQNGTGANWVLPSNAFTAWFQSSNIEPVWIYSQLPQTTNVLEGDEFSISDSPTATWGANVTTGSSSNHILVRYNGTNYTVVAK